MRQRMIKPEFFDSESLGVCSFQARILFVGLWVMADDYGNLRLQASRLRNRIFLYDNMNDKEFLASLCELEAVGCIKGYESEGKRYINIPNFSVYQTINRKSKTNNPDPPDATKKSQQTSLVNQWLCNPEKTLTECSVNQTLSESSVSTHPKERKKERRNRDSINRISIPKRNGRSVADAESAAPLLPDGWRRTGCKCRKCGSLQVSDGDTFLCPQCDEGAIRELEVIE